MDILLIIAWLTIVFMLLGVVGFVTNQVVIYVYLFFYLGIPILFFGFCLIIILIEELKKRKFLKRNA